MNDNKKTIERYTVERYDDGTEVWSLNGKLHREDGPAVFCLGEAFDVYDAYKEWWWHGERIDCKSQEEFDRLIRLKAFW